MSTDGACRDWDMCSSYTLQIFRTTEMEYLCGHPNIEMLIRLENGETHGNITLDYILRSIIDGKKYKAGDRVTITPKYCETCSCEVEFREYEDGRGKYLRAVILGIEKEYQSLTSEEAYKVICKLNEAHSSSTNQE
ncbi:MAG: hypothetical protein ACI396_00050 [Acutalibacteraceae bacterium]